MTQTLFFPLLFFQCSFEMRIFFKLFFHWHRNQLRRYDSSIEMTTTVCMAKTPIWLQKKYSNQRPPSKQWHLKENHHSIMCAWTKAISKFYCVICYWSKITGPKSTQKNHKQMISYWNSKDRLEIWYNLKICFLIIRIWSLDHRLLQLIWNKREPKRYASWHFHSK